MTSWTMSPRWRKLSRDLLAQRGRLLLLAGAVMLSLTVIGMALGAYAILMREMPRNYAATKPASATLELGGDIPAALVDEVRQRPGIADAVRRGFVRARAKVDGEWTRLLLYVVDDFEDLRLNVFESVEGARIPPDGAMLIERMASPVLKVQSGQHLLVKTPHASEKWVAVAGIVRDPGQPQAWQEHAGYGYISRETLARLGEPVVQDELRIATIDATQSENVIESVARELSTWLRARGLTVRALHVPPPGKHPHQFQIALILVIQLVFGAMVLVLGGILVATSIDAMLARQIREIGVMKAVGATSAQIAALYGAIVVLLGVTATGMAMPIALIAARRSAAGISSRMNFTLESQLIPTWVFIVLAASGVAVPALVASRPILRATRLTVRQAIDEWGVSAVSTSRSAIIDSWAARKVGRPWLLALRNASRARRRLALTVALLAVGGAIFMMAWNVVGGWDRKLAGIIASRHYDIEVRLSEPQSSTLAKRVRAVPGVRVVEAWGSSPTAAFEGSDVALDHAFPDHTHGSTYIFGPPADTRLVRLPLREGRWLKPDDMDAAVLTPVGIRLFPNAHVGDSVTLSVYGAPVRWHVVGIADEFGPAPAAYVTDRSFARAARSVDFAQLLRIATEAESEPQRNAIVGAIEDELGRAGASVETVISVSALRSILGDHMGILTGALTMMSLLMAAVGSMALSSTISIGVLQRTRELGVMKAIGATAAVVRNMIVAEGLLAGVLGWICALILAVPVTLAVGEALGTAALGSPIFVLVSPPTALAWLGITVLVSILASMIPANRAAKLTVREALGVR